MLIETFKEMPAGKLTKYPFDKLNPGQKLTIALEDHEKDPFRVRAALHSYKKYNSLKWITTTRVEGENIVVYRLK